MALSNLLFPLVHLCRSQAEKKGGTTAQMSAKVFSDPSFLRERVQNTLRLASFVLVCFFLFTIK